MRRRELYTIFFIIFVNSLYFLILFLINSAYKDTFWYQFTWLAEWLDHKIILSRSSELKWFKYLFEFPVLGALYLYGVGHAAFLSRSLMASYIPLTPFNYQVIYMGLFSVLFEMVIVILTMRLISRYFGQVYASNIMFIFILLPIVWWVTISRWEMLPLALTVCTLYFTVENKSWFAWISLTVATLVKLYPIIFAIPLLLYYLERDGFKKTVIYILSMIVLGALIHIPFFLVFGTDIFFGVFFQSTRPSSPYSIWHWIFLLFGGNEIVSTISVLTQVGCIITYVLMDYFYERRKENPLSIDKILIKRCSIAILLFLLTFKMAGYHYVIYAFPFVLVFTNCFKKFIYFIFWITAFHIATYLTIVIYGFAFLGKKLIVASSVLFLITIMYAFLYTTVIVLIHVNKKLFESTIPILNENDFMLGVYNFVKRVKSHK